MAKTPATAPCRTARVRLFPGYATAQLEARLVQARRGIITMSPETRIKIRAENEARKQEART